MVDGGVYLLLRRSYGMKAEGLGWSDLFKDGGDSDVDVEIFLRILIPLSHRDSCELFTNWCEHLQSVYHLYVLDKRGERNARVRHACLLACLGPSNSSTEAAYRTCLVHSEAGSRMIY